MNKPLLLSLAAATILTTGLNAESMYDRIQTMELQMKQMQSELTTLREAKAETTVEDEEIVEDDSEAVSDLEEDEEADMEAGDDEDEEDEDDDEEEMDIEEEIIDMQESITDLNKATNGSHLKLKVDYRFALDNIQYKMADGSDQGNDAFMTNRLWIDMNWKATEHLSFTGQLAYNKAFGARSGNSGFGSDYESFDWITNENAYDGVIRVRSAYFLYKDDNFLGEDRWTFSIGRRPSTNGHLINLRDDDVASSPMGHTINVEFDGLSAKFALENALGVDGMYFKLCAGRGGSNAGARMSAAPYATDGTDIPDIDLAGLIFVPYNDGQYGIATQYYYANNLIDVVPSFSTINTYNPTTGAPNGSLTTAGAAFDTVGGLHSFTANFTMNGIGDEWSDYLDETFFFLSGAVSVTDPKADRGMLGSANGESRTGYSVWAGLQMPSFMTEDGRWGVEYNKGSAYWRSVTYGEDTNIGSKVAARGDAYEMYFTEPLVEDILSLQIRYTYIDYKYTGSNGFFGNGTGASNLISSLGADNPYLPAYNKSNVVDTAQDIRFYIRYRY